MYVVVRTRVTQNKKELFGCIVTPFYSRDINGHPGVIGSFDTLDKAKEAVCHEIGYHTFLPKTFNGTFEVSTCWKKQWLGRYKDVYAIVPVKEESI